MKMVVSVSRVKMVRPRRIQVSLRLYLLMMPPPTSNPPTPPGIVTTPGGISWWRHQMETFSALLGLCVGNSQLTDEILSQRPVLRSSDVFFDLRMNKRLSKRSWGWWFETSSRSLWRHCNVYLTIYLSICLSMLISWFSASNSIVLAMELL